MADDDEAMAIESAQYSLYADEHGNWFLILVRCPDYRSMEIGIPRPKGHSLKEGDVLRGIAYDEKKGGWLTSMYYYTHFGIEDVVVTVGSVDPEAAVFSVSGSIHSGALGDLKALAFTATATRSGTLRKVLPELKRADPAATENAGGDAPGRV